MYCKNCGQQIDDKAVVCIHCGVGVGTGIAFCQNCGASVAPGAIACVKCGSALSSQTPRSMNPAKSKIVAGILGILLGSLGIHNFYLGFTGKGIAQVLISVCTCGVGSVVSGIWGLIEGIMILTGNIAFDANGNPLGE